VNGEGIASHYISRNLHVLEMNGETVKPARTSDVLLALNLSSLLAILARGCDVLCSGTLSFVILNAFKISTLRQTETK